MGPEKSDDTHTSNDTVSLGLSAEEVLTTTRAVRRRLDLERAVPTSVVLDCLRIALQAPSGGNVQQWRWIIVTDAAKRHAIAELYRDAALANFEHARDTTDDAATRRTYADAVDLANKLEQVPVIVIPCALGRVDGASNALASGFYGSIIPAVWSFQLALRAHGLGSVYTTAGLGREDRLTALLGIPDDVSPVAILPVAYTLGTDFRLAPRQPVEGVTYLDSWESPVR
jgi:nitroreductase